MNTPSEAVPEVPLGANETSAGATRTTRAFYWSVRRELWENRSVWVAPLIVAAVALFGFAISTFGLAERRRAALLLDTAQQRTKIGMPYDMAALVLIVTGLVVALFYALDALHGERRDRSILFWKSMPVSDLTTVLAKASIPLVVVPLLVFVLVFTVQVVMFVATSVVLIAHGMSPGSTFAGWSPVAQPLILAYGLIALVLWHAPLYAWFILVSGWARRAVFVWAVVPLIAFSAIFRVAWGSTDVCSLLLYRAIGGMSEAFIFAKGGAVHSLSQLTPWKFFTTPGLWLGLALAVAFFAAAVHMRRTREPI